MAISEINSKSVFSSYEAQLDSYKGKSLPAVQKTKIPEIKDTFGKMDETKDGKFSYFQFGKNVVKGAGKFFLDIGKTILKHPIMSLVGVGFFGAMAASPLGLAFLAGMGMTVVLFEGTLLGINMAKLAAKGKWDELEKSGEKLGKLIPAGVMSGMGAIKSIKMMSGAQKAGNFLSCTRKAVELDAKLSWIFIKNAGKTTFNGVVSMIKNPKKSFTKEFLKKTWNFKDNIKTDYKATVKNLDENIFSKQEIKYLQKDAKLFSLNPKNFKDNLPYALKELGDT